MAASDKSVGVSITEDEAALYDRQIRLWGLDAQKRLRGATVLLVGVSGLGAEMAKNIVLSGIKSLTLMDHNNVSEEDRGFQFLVHRDDIGKNRAVSSLNRVRQLNPMVEITAETCDSATKSEDYFTQFNVVCLTDAPFSEIERVDGICRKAGIQFFAGSIYGIFGFMFADLNTHEFSEEMVMHKKKATESGSGEPSAKKPKVDSENETKTVKKTTKFVSFNEAVTTDWRADRWARKLRRNPPIAYFVVRVLEEFRAKEGRLPRRETLSEDRTLLTNYRKVFMESLGLAPNLIPESFTEHCVSQFNPVCAIVGGIIAGEVVKGVSQKDAPINNFFLYNGLDGLGSVEELQ